MRVGVSGIPGNVEEIAVVDQFESRRLDLRRDQRFVRTVQGLDDARARALFRWDQLGSSLAGHRTRTGFRIRPPPALKPCFQVENLRRRS